MAGKRSLGDRLKEKWTRRGSSKSSKSPVTRASQPRPGVDQAPGTDSGPGSSTTIDGTMLARQVDTPGVTVLAGAEAIITQDHHEVALPLRLLPAKDASYLILGAEDQMIQKHPENAELAVDGGEPTGIRHVDLWDRAYEMLRARDASLVDSYERILDNELKASIRSKSTLGAVTSVGISVGFAAQNVKFKRY